MNEPIPQKAQTGSSVSQLSENEQSDESRLLTVKPEVASTPNLICDE